MIHQSHSRKDLLQISDIFTIKVDDKLSLSKKELSDAVWESLASMKEIEPDKDFFFIKNKNELLTYLINPHQLKSLTCAEKQEIIKFSRHIIHYCENDFVFYPYFKDLQDLTTIASHVANFGDISTVRRALGLLKYDKKICPSIEPILSRKLMSQIKKDEELNRKKNTSLKVKRGCIIVKFDD